ncbi:MAG: DUF1700 domain-containing protein [Clostridia bacterium]|nr:DUF1700 domain-containing protein [Clostridia bacterium]
MGKQEFIKELKGRLKGISDKDLNERISFYSEMIDDLMENGKTEEEAVSELGSIDEIVKQVISETPLLSVVKEKIRPKKTMSTAEKILIVLGFPVWFPLLITVLALAFTFYVLLWVGVIVVYSVEISFIGVAFAGVVGFFAYLFGGELNLISIGAGLIGLGLSVPFYYVCAYLTKGTLKVSRSIALKIKTRFMGKK